MLCWVLPIPCIGRNVPLSNQSKDCTVQSPGVTTAGCPSCYRARSDNRTDVLVSTFISLCLLFYFVYKYTLDFSSIRFSLYLIKLESYAMLQFNCNQTQTWIKNKPEDKIWMKQILAYHLSYRLIRLLCIETFGCYLRLKLFCSDTKGKHFTNRCIACFSILHNNRTFSKR